MSLVSLICFTACENSNNASNTEPYYDSDGNIHYKQSKFFILTDSTKGFTTDEYGKYIYKYRGSITNGTDMIFKEANVSMTIIFTLTNGVQLTDSVINAGQLQSITGGLQESHSIEMFEPKQTCTLYEFISYPINKKYKSYPIKKVVVSFRIELYYEIDGKYYYRFIKDEDITNDWKNL